MKLLTLPLGARFKYQPTDDEQFVLLKNYGCGLIAPWKGISGNGMNAIYSATETEEEFKNLEVCDVN